MNIISKATEYLKAYFTIKAMENIKKEIENELKSYFNDADDKSIVLVDEAGQSYKISFISTSRVSYDGDKLFDRIKPKEVRDKIVHNEATITDWSAFKDIMVKHGVPVDEVKQYLDIYKVVDKSQFQQQVEIGNLDLRDVADCYDIKVSDYLKITTLK